MAAMPTEIDEAENGETPDVAPGADAVSEPTEQAAVFELEAESDDPDEIDPETAELDLLLPETHQHVRMVEALLFAAAEPLDYATLKARLPKGLNIPALVAHLQAQYEPRGVNLVQIAGKWAFRTAGDMAFLLRKETNEQKRLTRAGIETLAIVAYHQPVTRAEIEEIRGVGVSKGTLDLLMEIGWVRPRGRRRTPGRPVTYGTTEPFLQHFGLDRLNDLPGVEELKLAGLLDSSVPMGFGVPSPSDLLSADEDPLDEADIAELLAPKPDDE